MERRPDEPVTIFVYGRPGHWRNCWEMASLALEELKHRLGDRVRIVTAGAWAEGGGAQMDIKRLGLLDYRATGELYRHCDVGLALTVSKHPSYLPLELMACGVPVVAFDNPWGHWILEDGSQLAAGEADGGLVGRSVGEAVRRRRTATPVAGQRARPDRAEPRRLGDGDRTDLPVPVRPGGPAAVMSPPATGRRSGGLLAITCERVGERMAGPAIRAVELARAVSRAGLPVTLVSLSGVDEGWAGEPRAVHARSRELRELVEHARVVLIQGDVIGLEPWLVGSDVPIVVDAYDPFHFEQLEQAKGLGELRRRTVVRDCVTSLNRQFARADLVLAASPEQRAMWLGHLAALGRVNPLTYDESADLGDLIKVVPFGLAPEPPVHSGTQRIRAAFPQIGPAADVVLWAGGLYDWFDPAAAVSAVSMVRERGRDVHLVLLGAAHPVLGTATRAEVSARVTAKELGLLGTGVHFVEEWIPYAQRADWLLEADLGIIATRAGIEAQFAFRTRLLDHLWCGLPTVATAGDPLGERMAAAGAAILTPPADVTTLADAVQRGLSEAFNAHLRDAARELAPDYRWPLVARPLVEFCRKPRHAPDLLLDRVDRSLLGLRAGLPEASVMTKVEAVLRVDGLGAVAERLGARLHRRLKP